MRPGAKRLLPARGEHLSCGVFLGRPGRFFSPGSDFCSCGRVFVSEFAALRCAARAFSATRQDRRRHFCCSAVSGRLRCGQARLLLVSRLDRRHRRMLLLHLCARHVRCFAECFPELKYFGTLVARCNTHTYTSGRPTPLAFRISNCEIYNLKPQN